MLKEEKKELKLSDVFQVKNPNEKQMKELNKVLLNAAQARTEFELETKRAALSVGLMEIASFDAGNGKIYNQRGELVTERVLDRETVGKLVELVAKLQVAELEEKSSVLKIKKSCNCPVFAKLSVDFRWVGEDGQLLSQHAKVTPTVVNPDDISIVE